MVFDIYAQGREYARQMQYIPVGDIRTAFTYYMKHFNQGRPFILLGHSQGSNMLIELLKEGMTDEQHRRMIAAYLIGFEITAEELASYPNRLRPASGQYETGVVISFNSVTDPTAKTPLLKNTVVCINPVNWTTDGTPSAREAHKGFIKFDKQKGVYVTTPHYTEVRQKEHCLVCTDVPAGQFYNEKIKDLFPYGNLHLANSWLYSVNLKENMEERTVKFRD